jgi:hypothetical protein
VKIGDPERNSAALAIAVTAQLVGLCSMDWPDYLRDEAAKYRQLAEQTDDPVNKKRAA